MDGHTITSRVKRPAKKQSAPLPAGLRSPRGGLEFSLATPQDDPEIRRLLRENPLDGAVAVTLEREPDTALAATVEGDRHYTIIARDLTCRRIACVGSVWSRMAYVNGIATRLGYLGQLRLDRPYRGRADLLLGGHKFFREMHPALGANFYLASITNDNSAAQRFLGLRILRGMPKFQAMENLTTLTLQRPHHKCPLPHGVVLERGSTDRLGDIADFLQHASPRFQFAPCWTSRRPIRSPVRARIACRGFFLAVNHERIIGCLARWNQCSFKQMVIRSYHQTPIADMPQTSADGTKLPLDYVSHLAVENDDPTIFAALLTAAFSQAQSPDRILALGLSERHPLLATAQTAFECQAYCNVLYTAHWPDGEQHVAALDGRIAHPEIALL